MNNFTKAAIGIGGAVLLYHLFSNNGSGSSMGDLDTAKTKAGRERQRRAAFARMDSSGEAWPKKGGKRVKPRKKSRKR